MTNNQNSKSSILIKNGKIINADETLESDVLIENGLIKNIAKDLQPPSDATRIIDASGKYIFPGGIDPHTHFEMEFMGTVTADDFFSGTRAAIAGGTTTIIDFVFGKIGDSLLEKYKRYRDKADGKVCCDYGLHVCITEWNEKVRNEMKVLVKNHGVNSFKFFMAYEFMLNDCQIYELLEVCKELGALPLVHAENGCIIRKNVERLKKLGIMRPEGHALARPEDVEAEAVNRVCVIAKQVDCPIYVVHIMSIAAAEALERNQIHSETRLFGETLAAALGSDGSHYRATVFRDSAAYVLSPPLRAKPETQEYLLKKLASGVLESTGSDHCTFTAEQKAMGRDDFSKIPNGVNGVEERLLLLWEKGVNAGILPMQRFVEVSSANAAKLFNLYPKKGCVKIGSDADVVVWNPEKVKIISAATHHITIDFNIYEDTEIRGCPEFVIVNGDILMENEELNVKAGSGKFLRTPPFAPFIFPQEELDDDYSSISNDK